MPPDARDLLTGLLDRNPRKRLGARLLGATEVRCHPFFTMLDWGAVARKELVPPFRPILVRAGAPRRCPLFADFLS